MKRVPKNVEKSGFQKNFEKKMTSKICSLYILIKKSSYSWTFLLAIKIPATVHSRFYLIILMEMLRIFYSFLADISQYDLKFTAIAIAETNCVDENKRL